MRYIKISGMQDVIDHLVDTLTRHLENDKRVLWLVPGGSAIAIAAEVSKRLTGQNPDNLHVTLTDERYGDVGHADSNWRQLTENGFTLPGAQLIPVLTGTSVEETTAAFAATLARELSDADFCIGLFGMGADGHTAGVLPGSVAVTSSDHAAFYETPDYARLTMTPVAIARLDEAVLYATGTEKEEALEKLRQDAPLNEQPAQILKKVPVLTVYNDYKGDQT